MLTQDTITKNRATYIGLIEKYKICTPKLIEKLDELGFFLAPASTSTTLHGAYPGGLVDHLIRVTQKALQINSIMDAEFVCEKENIVRVGLLHGIGKAALYMSNPSDWHRKNLGKMYNFNESLTSMSVAERSIFYIFTFGGETTLNDVEFQAILNYEKDLIHDGSVKWHTKSLGMILRQAIEWAIMKEKLMPIA